MKPFRRRLSRQERMRPIAPPPGMKWAVTHSFLVRHNEWTGSVQRLAMLELWPLDCAPDQYGVCRASGHRKLHCYSKGGGSFPVDDRTEIEIRKVSEKVVARYEQRLLDDAWFRAAVDASAGWKR